MCMQYTEEQCGRKKILSPKMCVEIFYTPWVCSTMQTNVESMHDTNGEHTV